jgi:hypothetical protein
VSKDGSYVPNEMTSSKAGGMAKAKRSETRIVSTSLESDVAKGDMSPTVKHGTGYSTKRHPTLLRIQLKQAAKSMPRNTMQAEDPKPHPSVCTASADRESLEAITPLAQAQVDQGVSSAFRRTQVNESKSGSTNSPAETRTDLDASQTAAARLQRNADGIEPGNPKAEGKSPGTSKSLASDRSDGNRFIPLPNSGERSESTKALPQVRADTGHRKALPAADTLHSIRQAEHDRESYDVASDAKSTAQGRSEVDDTSAAKISTSTKHEIDVNTRDLTSVVEASSLRMALAPEPFLPGTTLVTGPKEAQEKVPSDPTKSSSEQSKLVRDLYS